MSTRGKIFVTRLLISVMIVYSIMPIVSRLISSFLTTYFYLLLLLITVASIVFAKGLSSLNKYFSILLPFILWKLLIFLVSRPSLIEWGYSSLNELAPILFGYIIVYRMNWKNQKFFSIILIAALAVTAITTTIGLQIYPDAARYLATVASSDDPEFILLNMFNIGGYEFIYSIVLAYPLLIYAYKIKKIPRIVMILSALFMLFFVISAGYTTALLLFLISSLFFFFNKNISPRFVIVLLICILLFAVIFFPLFSLLFKFLSDHISNEAISERLLVLANGREGFEQTDDKRLDLYWMSISSFLKYPLFGSIFTKNVKTGGHSFLLDAIAHYGILGITLLVWMYRKMYRIFYRPYRKTVGYGYIFWMFLQAMILSLVNTGMWIKVLCLYLPVLLILIRHEGETHESTLGR